MGKIEGSLIVSCQALDNEPLHSSFIMGRMALAAREGGAKGIRANGVEDIREIKNNVDLPIIGIIKRNYGENPVFITPTMAEVDMLAEEGVDIIAIDMTGRKRPDNKDLETFIREIRTKYPGQLLMADISNLAEAKMAQKLGVDFIGTTLVGYTEYTKNFDPLEELQKILSEIQIPVIAEGNINTPDKAKKALEMGAFAVVVGSMITRPQIITRKFVEIMEN